MITSNIEGRKELEKIIVKNIPRDAFMAFEDAYRDGDSKGREHSKIFAKGHRPSAAGHNKHFFINETFQEALLAHGASPMPLRGTKLVVGRLGIFNIARLNVAGHKWTNLRSRGTRATLAELNDNISRKFVQGDLFAMSSKVADGTIFILGIMDGIDANGMSQITQVMVALPAPDMKSWLYLSTMADFQKLYDQPDSAAQLDKATPKLKAQPKKQKDDDKRN